MTTPTFYTILVMATDTLRRNTLRTGLSMLGIVIGVASVIAITSIGRGVQQEAEEQLQTLGTNVLFIAPGAATTGAVSQGMGSATTLTWEDAQALETQVTAVSGVAPILRVPVHLVYGSTNDMTTVVGTEPDFPQVASFTLQQGRFFTEAELNTRARVVILGAKVHDRLFGANSTSLSKSLRVAGQSFEVIGVMAPKGSIGGTDRDDQIYIPISTLSTQIVGNNAISGVAVSGIWLSTAHLSQLEAAQFQVTNLLRLRHRIYSPEDDDFNVTNQVDLFSTVGTVINLFTLMIAAVGSISLLVGGIGIANIMFVTVVERTCEIGIRKALGATETAILQQFLMEAIAISLVGGVVGIALGMPIAFAAVSALQVPFLISSESIVISGGLALTVGLLAGVIPARRAARLDPIAALRGD
ncbi:MAG: ABC transporter permease [Elainellaceae cyanobacterium]